MTTRPRGQKQGRRDDRRTPNRIRNADESGIGGDVVIGRNSVRELLAAGKRQVREVLIGDAVNEAPIIEEIRQLAQKSRVSIRNISREELMRIGSVESTQSVVAYAKPIEPVDLEKLVAPSKRVQPLRVVAPFLMVVDGVTDPRNLGALLRTAEVAGVTGVVLGRNRSARLSPTATKAAAGAIEHLDFAYVPNVAAAVADLKKANVWVAALEMEAKTSLFDFNLADEPLALVMGAEGKGVSQLVRDRCDVLVSIPQFGNTESLNVSVAGALAMYEVARRRAI